MKPKRKYVTPFLSLLFVVLAITGLFMLFHLFDGYTEVAHEIIGIGFVVVAMFHILLNWNGLKIHFKKQVFMPAAVGVAALTSLFIYLERKQLPLDIVIVDKTFKAPLKESFKILDIDYTTGIKKLESQGYDLSELKTLEDIWKKNDTDPQEVFDLLIN